MKQARENGKDLPVMMYLHGFMSGANGAKQRQLQKHFKGRWRVIVPELDADPEKSLAIIDELIEKERPEIIVGTSLGAWMAMMCRHGVAPLVLVNPVTAPQEELTRRGTGISLPWMPASFNCLLKRMAPKWEKKVAIKVCIGYFTSMMYSSSFSVTEAVLPAFFTKRETLFRAVWLSTRIS